MHVSPTVKVKKLRNRKSGKTNKIIQQKLMKERKNNKKKSWSKEAKKTIVANAKDFEFHESVTKSYSHMVTWLFTCSSLKFSFKSSIYDSAGLAFWLESFSSPLLSMQ